MDYDIDIIIIGISVTETYYMTCDDGKFYSEDEGDIKEYEDFDDLLTYASISLEGDCKDCLGEDWADLYDERFGNE